MLAWLLIALQGAADPAQSLVRLQEAIRREPARESHYTDLGNLLLGTQNFKEAALVLENAKRRFPDSAQVRLSLGVAYYGQRRFPDAVGAFLEAAQRDTEAEQPVLFLGRILEHAGPRVEEVKSVFAGYAATHPKHFLGHFLYGKAAGDAAALRKAIALEPRFPDSHFELGSLLEQTSDWKPAAAAYEQAARLAPANPAPQFRLMRVYARLGLAAKSAAAKQSFDALSAREKAEADKRQAAAKHMELTVKP